MKFTFVLVVLFAMSVAVSFAVQILELEVPPLVKYGSEESIILDCNYDFSENERKGLVIMWFFGADVNPFLQWIPGRRPQLIDERFRDYVDLDFAVAHEEDEAKKHRALKIVNPSPELSGTYKCKVSTLLDEDFKQKNMIIYAPASEVEFVLENLGDSNNLTCSVTGVSPEPSISITWATKENTSYVRSEPLVIMSFTSQRQPQQDEANSSSSTSSPLLFNASLSLSLSSEELDGVLSDDKESVIFSCQVSLGQSELEELTAVETFTYYPGREQIKNFQQTDVTADSSAWQQVASVIAIFIAFAVTVTAGYH